MKSYFFNAEPTMDLQTHPTGYDRAYDADDHAAFFAPFFSEAGVMAGTDADACKVEVDSGQTLRVRAGRVYVRGRMAEFDGAETITVTQDAKIVARMNKTADVRGFQLLAVQALTRTEDIYDLELASAALTAVTGGYEVLLTDTRTFMAFSGQPPYYPPDTDGLPYALWLYTLGYPMTPAQEAAVTGNPDLMRIFDRSIGPLRQKNPAQFRAYIEAAPNAVAPATAQKLWPAGQVPADPTVDTALGRLANSAVAYDPAGKTLTDFLGNELAGPVKIEIGSYVGTGLYGAGSPNQLAIPGDTVMIAMLGCKDTFGRLAIPYTYNGDAPVFIPIKIFDLGNFFYIVRPSSIGNAYNSTFSYNKAAKTIVWYCDGNSEYQLNGKDYTYYYAIFRIQGGAI